MVTSLFSFKLADTVTPPFRCWNPPISSDNHYYQIRTRLIEVISQTANFECAYIVKYSLPSIQGPSRLADVQIFGDWISETTVD